MHHRLSAYEYLASTAPSLCVYLVRIVALKSIAAEYYS
jgi:hypothetical protein